MILVRRLDGAVVWNRPHTRRMCRAEPKPARAATCSRPRSVRVTRSRASAIRARLTEHLQDRNPARRGAVDEGLQALGEERDVGLAPERTVPEGILDIDDQQRNVGHFVSPAR